MMNVAALLAVGILLAGGEGEPAPDVVELKNGRELEGRVVHEDEEALILLVRSRERRIELEEVASVRAARRELPRALDEIAALRAGDAAAHNALAATLDERNLPHEARLVSWKVLTFAPEDAVAHEHLGHRKRGESWRTPHSGRWYRLREREELLEDFGDAWELASTHFRVRTNLPLAQAVALTLDLERTYRAFYELLGRELELWEVTEPMEAWVHADAGSFPELTNGGRSYFSAADPRLYVNASRGLDLSTIVHEATHALIHHSARHTRSGRGRIPGWLDEGLAEYLEASLVGRSGSLRFQLGRPNRYHFATHAGAQRPFRLNRVLNFQAGDFLGTSKTQLKYAQSYTLVHFGLHGEGGCHRPSFFAFVRGAYEGQGSSTHFKKAIGVRESELEEAWHRYAKDPAGS